MAGRNRRDAEADLAAGVEVTRKRLLGFALLANTLKHRRNSGEFIVIHGNSSKLSI
jgi:hypothetical protein